MQKIGLQALLEDKDFQAGIQRYIDSLQQAETQTDKSSGGMSGTLGSMAKVAGAGLAALGTALVATAAGVVAFVSSAKDVAPVEAAFKKFGGSIEELREATQGMVSDAELMKNYNLAMQLVGDSLGKQLPEAMSLLTKVSSATGESMDYLMNSLIRGIGRLSPMILDNLGIQVNLSEAYDKYAEQIGKSASALSKQEQHTALLSMAMEKLRENTASLGDLSGTAVQGFAQFQTTLQNLKNEIGTALWPAVQPVLTGLTNLGQQIMPILADAATRLGTVLGDMGQRGMNALVGLAEDAIPGLVSLTEGFFKVIEGVSAFIDKLKGIDPTAVAVGASISGLGLALPFLSTALSGLPALIGGVTAAFGSLTALLAANPIFLAAAAIAGAGVVIAKIIDDNKKRQEEATAAVKSFSDSTVQAMLEAGASYDQYLAKVGEVVIEQEQLPIGTDAVAAGLQAVDAGLALTEAQYAALNMQMNTSLGAMSSSADALRGLREANEAAARAANKTTGDLEMLANAFEGQEAATQIAIQTWEEAGTALAEAFQTAEVQKALEGITNLVQKHQDDIDKLERNFQKQEEDALFQFGLDRLKAEQAYTREHTALLAAGKADDAAQLTSKYAEEQAQAEYNYDLQTQLRQKQLLDQQVLAAENYQRELEMQRDAILRSLALKVEGMQSEGLISENAANQALSYIALQGSEQLRLEMQSKAKSLELSRAWASGTVDSYEFVVESMAILEQAEKDAATKLAELTAKQKAFEIKLPPLPELRLDRYTSDVKKSSGEIKAATEPATKTMAQVADDISKSVEQAKKALRELAKVEVPEAAAEGLQKVADFLRAATEQMYVTLEPLGAKLKAVKELIEPATDLMELLTTATKALGVAKPLEAMPDLGLWQEQVLLWLDQLLSLMSEIKRRIDIEGAKEASELADAVSGLFDLLGIALEIAPVDPAGFEARAQEYVRQLGYVAGLLYHWMEDIISRKLEDAVKEAAAISDDVSKLFGLIGPDLGKAVPVIDSFSEKAQVYVGQLRELGGYLYHWMQEIVDKGFALAVEEAAKASESVAKLFGLIGPDLSKVIPSGAGWGQRARIYVAQLRDLGGVLYHWMQEIIVKGFAPAVEEGAKVGENVTKLFGLIGPDLGKVIPVGDNFGDKARAYVGQLRELGSYLYSWTQEIIVKGFAPAVEEGAKVGENVAKFFGLIGPNLKELVPADAKTFSAKARTYVGQLRELGSYLYTWMREIVDKGFALAVEEAAKVGESVSKLFGLLGLDFADIALPPANLKQTVELFFAGIAETIPLLIDKLGEVSKRYSGDVLDAAGATVEKIKKVFDLLTLKEAFEAIRTVSPLQPGARRWEFGLAMEALMANLAKGLEIIVPKLQQIKEDWYDAMLDVADVSERMGQLFEALGNAGQAMEEFRFNHPLNINNLNTLLSQMAQVIRLAGGLAVTPLLPGGTVTIAGGEAGMSPLVNAIQQGITHGADILQTKIVDAIQGAFGGTEILVVFKQPGRGDVVGEVAVGQQRLVTLGAVA